jgi:tetratricopeptide (TPR) repeat protein
MPVDFVQKAIDLLEKGRAEQAAPLLEDVVDAFPAYAGAYVLLARAYESGERWTRALEAWRSALLLVPDSPVAMEGVRRALRQGRRISMFSAGTDADSVDALEALHHVATEHPGDSGDEPSESEEPSPQPPSPTTPVSEPARKPEAETPPRSTVAGSPADANLEQLISELEGARITPRPDLDDIPPPEFEDDIEDMVSETLARIYASQGQFIEAARVFDTLADQHPDRRTYFHQKAREMRASAGEGQ